MSTYSTCRDETLTLPQPVRPGALARLQRGLRQLAAWQHRRRNAARARRQIERLQPHLQHDVGAAPGTVSPFLQGLLGPADYWRGGTHR